MRHHFSITKRADISNLSGCIGGLYLANTNVTANWMKDLSDDTPLEAINFPGTHDAAACQLIVPA